MSSLTMLEPLAIRLRDVSKVYKLHGSQGDQLIDVLGLQRFGFRTKTIAEEFVALSNITLDVPRGHRIGIIGRNGAGKTTLLKLLCGNFSPTDGVVEVYGTVQALMSVGIGFHPEYTGRENVVASLQYNGLGRDEYLHALEGIMDFCELGIFLDQPFKTYSLGMQARLMFATATAIRPDILIVDEVLGAGDAYFVAKSKLRVEKLVNSGCTMLLVSHSMQQVLELCKEAIWLDNGQIRMQDDAFLVVKAYEAFLHGPMKAISLPNIHIADETSSTNGLREHHDTNDHADAQQLRQVEISNRNGTIALQEPAFCPHAELPSLANVPISDAGVLRFVAPGGLSRWESQTGLKVCGFSIVTERGITNKLVAMRPVKFVIFLVVENSSHFNCRYGIAVHDPMGLCVARIFSQADKFIAQRGDIRCVEVLLNPNQLGAGNYTVGISALDATSLEQINAATRYDLLGRSFCFSVELPESIAVLGAAFFHSAEWSCSSVTSSRIKRDA